MHRTSSRTHANQTRPASSTSINMAARIGPKHVRRSLRRVRVKSYIHLVTVLVVAGIFISEGSVKSVSKAQIETVTSQAITPDHVDSIQLLWESEKMNSTEKVTQNGTDSAFSAAKVTQTLNKLLQEAIQEAIPEKLSGLSNKESSILEEQQILNTTSSLKEAPSGKLPLNNIIMEKHQNALVQHLKTNSSSQILASMMKTKSPQASPNGTEFIKNSPGRTGNGHSPFKGVLPTEETKQLFQTDNVTHLSFMIYRLIKTHGIKSLLDIPCKRSMLWMKDLLQVLEFEVPKFHYKCLTPDDESLAEGVVRFQHLSSATLLKNERPWASRLPPADLALCWYGLGFLPPDQSWGLLKSLRTAGVKFVVVPNYPEVRNNPGSGSALGRINVRRAPYRFNEPLRVVNNISTHPSTPKQLLFYDLEGIRRDAL